MSAHQLTPVEQIAEGLQRLINESDATCEARIERAAERAANETERRMNPKFDAIHHSLREVWKAVNGKGKLPIDD